MQKTIFILGLLANLACQTTRETATTNSADLEVKPKATYEGFNFIVDNGPRIDDQENGNLFHYENIKNLSPAVAVMYWHLQDGDVDNLNHNLQALLNSNLRPDVLILSEVKVNYLNATTKALLKQKYSYSDIQNLGSRITNFQTIVYASSTANDKKIIEDGIRWIDPTLNDRNAWTYMKDWEIHNRNRFPNPGWNRHYLRYTFAFHGQKYHIIPANLAPVWSMTGQKDLPELGYFQSRSEKFTLASQSANPNSPMHQQLKQFAQQINQDVGPVHEHQLVIGNFSSPLLEQQGLLQPFSKQMFTSAFKKPNLTFPAHATTNDVFQTDHVLTKTLTAEQKVHAFSPKLKGSRHYPVYLLIENSNAVATTAKR